MKQSLRNLFVLALLSSAGFQAQAQSVGIGTTTPHETAVLDLHSSSRGFLPPRMSQAQRGLIPVSSQSAGLLVYQTDGLAGYYLYNGAAWTQLGAQGPAGSAGPSGPPGPQGSAGPQGPSGSLDSFGDGSGGALSLAFGNTLDLTTTAGFNSLAGRHHLQFTTLSIAGNLIVPSGTTIRATGNVTITGTITVAPGARDNGNGPPHPGISLAAPGTLAGGVGIAPLAAASLTRAVPAAGGSGDRLSTVTSGGEGGGSIVIVSQGNVNIMAGAGISANGNSGTNPTGSTDIAGGGGGAGGLIVVAAKGTLTVAGALRANGGQGANGLNGNGGTAGAGAGGGGGGGIIHLIASSTPAITGTVQALGGAAGTDALVSNGASTSNQSGLGGGASGGNGGAGGGGPFGSAPASAAAGASGYTITTVVPAPENLVF
ncbi:hypothetical protein [Hymenobacter sp. B81]|uniref:hypothetical protein n=1 Tax=Hymenobacter sp. B81 TaxID=3344878 RepID=UPI0037DC111D